MRATYSREPTAASPRQGGKAAARCSRRQQRSSQRSGYENAATKEIARRAQCSESLLFRYFGDKQGIFEKVVSRQVAEAVEAAEDKLAASAPGDIQ